MNLYEVMVKAIKKEFFTATIASTGSHPVQQFVIMSLSSLSDRTQNYRNLAFNCEASVSFLVEKILSLRSDLLVNIATIAIKDPIFDSFNQLSQAMAGETGGEGIITVSIQSD